MKEYRQSLEESANYVRLAIPMMSSHDVPITPRNYSVWYEYVSGGNSELREAIDDIIDKNLPFSEENNQMLYQRFCAEKEEQALSELRNNLRHLLMQIYAEVAEMSGKAEDYEALVSESVNKLTENISIQDVKNVVDEIITKTNQIGASGREMQQKLKEATAELEVLKKEFEEAKMEARVDFLTRLANRKAFDEMLEQTIQEAISNIRPLCLLLVDIDHFKAFNDQYGHLTGDKVLKFAAKTLKENVRGRDTVARYGGEEFAVILPETVLSGAMAVAENIRTAFAQGKLKDTTTSTDLGTLTVSVGATQFRVDESAKMFIQRSDQALYYAKETGRNRVATETDLESNQAKDL